MRLTDAEWKIDDCLWYNGPMAIAELTKAFEYSIGWSESTIKTLLKRMIDRIAVKFFASCNSDGYLPIPFFSGI